MYKCPYCSAGKTDEDPQTVNGVLELKVIYGKCFLKLRREGRIWKKTGEWCSKTKQGVKDE